MPIGSPRLRHGLRTVFGLRSQSWREAAVKHWELAPAETRPNATPICIDGQLDKVRSMPHDWRINNLPRLFEPTLTHKATTAHLLKNVELADTSLYSGRMHQWLSDHRPPIVDRRPVERIKSAVLASGYSGNKWFGHFLTDTSTLCLLAADVAEHSSAEVVAAPFITDALGQRRRYAELLQLPSRVLERAHFDELIIVDPLGLNCYRRAKMEELRRRIRNACTRSYGNHNVYVRRGVTGEKRALVNHSDIEALVESRGFRILEPETLAVDDVASAMMDAELVIGVDGSHLSHSLLPASEDACIIDLQPANRFDATLKVHAEHAGLRWGFLIGRPDVNGFTIDLDELKRTLDLVT